MLGLTKTQLKLLRTAIDSRITELDNDLARLDIMLYGDPSPLIDPIVEEIEQLKDARKTINKKIDPSIPTV